MFDRFNDPSKKVMSLSRQEAIRLGHEAILPEHVLLALLQNPVSVTAAVLKRIGVDTAALRGEVEAELLAAEPPGRSPPDAHASLPFSSETKQVLEATLEEATLLGHRYLGSEHLLLGVIRGGGKHVARALAARGLELESVRSKIRAALGEDAEA